MRFLLPFLAIVAMLANPAIAAAKAGCAEAAVAMASGMTMLASKTSLVSQPASPCCDPGAKTAHRDGKACAQACAAMAGVAVAPSLNMHGVVLTYTLAKMAAPPMQSPRAHDPGPLERPPRPIA